MSLPFLGVRIEEKSAETKSKTGAWIAQVKEIEAAYLSDLRAIVDEEQVSEAATAAAVDEALTDESVKKLNTINSP